MDYQKKQEEFYNSAMKKKAALKRLRIKNTYPFYTKQQFDAMNYIHGTDFYKNQQNLSMKPNKFDTGQTFVLKMHDPERRIEFLKSIKSKRLKDSQNS